MTVRTVCSKRGCEGERSVSISSSLSYPNVLEERVKGAYSVNVNVNGPSVNVAKDSLCLLEQC